MGSLLLPPIEGCLSCGINHCRLRSPNVLNCKQTFCRHCLENWANSLAVDRSSNHFGLLCSYYPYTTEMPQACVAALKPNYMVTDLASAMKSQNGEMEGELERRILCELCEAEEHEASYKCYNCEKFLCIVCKATHASFKVLRHHKVVDLRDLRGSDQLTELFTSEAGVRCAKHMGEALRFFCETCQTVICQGCTVVDHPRPAHSYADLKDVIGRKRKDLLQSVGNSKQIEAKLEIALNETIELGGKIETAALAARAGVNRMADHALVVSQKLVEQKRELHLQETDRLEMQRKKMVSCHREVLENHLASFRHTLDSAAELSKNGSDHAVLSTYQTLNKSLQTITTSRKLDSLENMKDLEKFKFSSQGHDSNHMLCQSVDAGSPLGHISGEWTLLGKIGCDFPNGGLRGPSTLAVSRFGEVIVVENQRQTAQVFGKEGKHRLTLNTRTNVMNERRVAIDKILGFIRSVALTRAGHIILCDCSQFVKVFSQHGRYLCAFTTTSLNDNCRGPVWLCCLAVDERNFIYVGDRNRRCVTIHEANGARARLVECSRPAQLAVTDQFIVVIPVDPTDSIKLLDHLGNTQRALSIPQSLHPWLPVSVTCSNDEKRIFVVNGHKDGVKAVHEFDTEGVYRGCITLDLLQPAGIAMSPSHETEELFVADENLVKIFRKVC